MSKDDIYSAIYKRQSEICDCEPFQSCDICRKDLSKPGAKKKSGRKSAAKAHLNWVASQGCIICGSVACVHHIRIMGEPRDDFKTIPLCHYHHQGSEGLHHLGKAEWRKRYGHELDYLKQLEKRKNP